MLRLLTLLLLASAQLKVRYVFNKIYDTKVIDLSHNGYHAVKDAPGGSSMINTPSGLYLSRVRLNLSPNTYSDSFPVASTCTANVFVRFFKITGVNDLGNFFNLNSFRVTDVFNGNSITPHKYQASATLSSGLITITTSTTYPYEVWVFLAVSVEYDGTSSTLKLYVNDAQIGVATGTGPLAPTTLYYLNGFMTDAIYYEFRYYWGALSLSDMQGTLFKIGAACSDTVNACLPDDTRLCNSNDAYHFDISCAACTMTNYACRDSVTKFAGDSGCTEGVANPAGSCLYPTEGDFCPVECGFCTSSSKCFICEETCQKCSLEVCLSCKDPSASPQGIGCICSSGFYDGDLSSSQSCLPCSPQCLTCDEALKCLSCVDTHAEAVYGVCTCKEDFVTGATGKCVACREGTFYAREVCVSCHSDCSTCSDYPSCNSCKDPDQLPALEGCRSCEEGTFLQDSSCEVCPWLCTSCSKEACLSCIANASVKEGKCSCDEGYLMDAEGCSAKPALSFTLSVSEENILTLSLNQTLSLAQTEVKVSIDGVRVFNFTIEASATEWQLLIDQSVKFDDGSECSVTLSLDETCPYKLANTSATVNLFKSVKPYTDEQQQPNAIFSFTQASSTIAVLASLSVGLVGSPSAAWGLISSIQLLGYIPMMDIDLPLALVEYFKASLDFNPLPNLFSYFVFEEGSVPVCAERQGFDSSNFLDNAGQLLTTSFLLALSWPLCCLFGLVSKHFRKAASEYRWNYFTRFVIQGSVELLVAALVQVFSSTLDPLSTGLSCVALLICGIAPAVFAYFIIKNASRFNNDSELAKKWGSVFKEFKNDRGWKSSSFYVVYLIRRLLYVTLLFTLTAFPLVQVILSAALSALAALYLVTYRPFKEEIMNYCTLFSELCSVLTFFVCSFFLLDLNSTIRDTLKWVALLLVYLITSANFLAALYLAFRSIIEKCKSLKAKSQVRLSL
jgi:hypothetical protein